MLVKNSKNTQLFTFIFHFHINTKRLFKRTAIECVDLRRRCATRQQRSWTCTYRFVFLFDFVDRSLKKYDRAPPPGNTLVASAALPPGGYTIAPSQQSQYDAIHSPLH